ncbi:hypothetical protein HMPREF1982_01388 [Clostridiales bacterium oral taxon 876 str. F0540]|nr:hypothetical protein HMPREF1982_01388 [Clostridiales bacterium oral taxon 876 str. F0540]
MLKKVFYWISIILQVLFVIAAYVIQYFSMKRMGMMRYVIFKNHEWEAQYPITALKYAAIIFLIILCVAAILYVKTKKGNYIKDKKALPMLIASIVLTLIFVLFTLIFSTGNYRSYYFTSLILAIITLIQHIKILLI